jgi:uncharacterized protein YbcI
VLSSYAKNDVIVTPITGFKVLRLMIPISVCVEVRGIVCILDRAEVTDFKALQLMMV